MVAGSERSRTSADVVSRFASRRSTFGSRIDCLYRETRLPILHKPTRARDAATAPTTTYRWGASVLSWPFRAGSLTNVDLHVSLDAQKLLWNKGFCKGHAWLCGQFRALQLPKGVSIYPPRSLPSRGFFQAGNDTVDWAFHMPAVSKWEPVMRHHSDEGVGLV